MNSIPKGVVTITKRNKDTLEIINSQTETNVFTETGYKAWQDNLTLFDAFLYMHDKDYIEGLGSTHQLNPASSILQSSVITGPTWFDGSPNSVEMVSRFDAPTIARTIYNVSVGLNNTWAYASFTTPCSQDTTEVIDITYTIYFQPELPSNAPNSQPMGENVGYMWSKKFGVNSFSEYSTPRSAYRHISTTNSAFNFKAGSFNDSPNFIQPLTNDFNYHNRKNTFTFNYTETEEVGRYFGSIGYGGNVTDDGAPLDTKDIGNPYICAVADLNSAYAPIQPIHNHNANSTLPYNDTANLANGYGNLTVDGDSWTGSGFMPYMYRIDITSTGETGAGSNYYFRKRKVIGFDGNTYDSIAETASIAWEDGNNSTISESHGFSSANTRNMIAYDDENTIFYDDSGLTIINLGNGDNTNLGISSTPSLPVSNLQFVIVNPVTNDIWAGCKVTGLFRIQDIMTTPVITHISNNNNGIDDTKCYGVTNGYNGSIWAVFDGGISLSTDNGTTWTNYNQLSNPIFDYPPITSDWTSVGNVAGNIDNPDNQIAIIYADPAQLLAPSICWWDNTGSFAPAIGLELSESYLNEKMSYPNLVQCSSNLWYYVSYPGNILIKAEFGTLNYESIVFQNIQGSNIILKDYYGNPVLFSQGNTVATHDSKLLDNVNSTNYSEAPALVNNNTLRVSNDMSKGRIIDEMSPDIVNDPLNGQHSVFEEVTWDKYHWNSGFGEWVKDYYAPAVDSSVSVTDAYRHNFDTESHFFTGRSLIDCTPSFNTFNFTSGTASTFAFTINGSPKLNTGTSTGNKQELDRTIFDISSPTQRFAIKWNTNISNNLIITDNTQDQVVTTTPIDGTDIRLVVSIAGDQVTIWIDAVEIITITTDVVYDFENTNDDLTAYLGANIYEWAFSKLMATPSNFFRGSITNFQLWDEGWNQSTVTEDLNAQSGTGIIAVTTNLVGRFQLTEPLSETKSTHSTPALLDEGINISFNDHPTSTPAFSIGDFYNFHVCEGIFKDNGIQFTHNYAVNFSNANYLFDDYNDPETNTKVIPAVAETDKAPLHNINWVYNGTKANTNDEYYQWNNTEVAVRSNVSGLIDEKMISFQSMIGDGSIEFTVNVNSVDMDSGYQFRLGLTSDPANVNYDDMDYCFAAEDVTSTDGVYIKESGADLNKPGIISFNAGDKFEINRTGTLITYKLNGAVVYTSSVLDPNNILYGVMIISLTASATYYGQAWNARMNNNSPAYMLQVGSEGNQSGIFNNTFRDVEINDSSVNNLLIGGVLVTNVLTSTSWNNDTTDTLPQVGEVMIYEKGGLLFNSADAGKTITGTIGIIADQI